MWTTDKAGEEGKKDKRHKKIYCNSVEYLHTAVDNNHDNDEENPDNGDKRMIMVMKNLHGWFKG